MERLSRELFEQGMKDLELNYGIKEMNFSAEKLDLWWRRFRFLSNKDFKTMIYNTIEFCKYPPNMAVLLDQRNPNINMKSVRELYPEEYSKKEKAEE